MASYQPHVESLYQENGAEGEQGSQFENVMDKEKSPPKPEKAATNPKDIARLLEHYMYPNPTPATKETIERLSKVAWHKVYVSVTLSHKPTFARLFKMDSFGYSYTGFVESCMAAHDMNLHDGNWEMFPEDHMAELEATIKVPGLPAPVSITTWSLENSKSQFCHVFEAIADAAALEVDKSSPSVVEVVIWMNGHKIKKAQMELMAKSKGKYSPSEGSIRSPRFMCGNSFDDYGMYRGYGTSRGNALPRDDSCLLA